jgi:nucleotide-binding universal stress UspA family protein
MITIERILCPVDFLPESDTAIHYATALAAAHRAKLKLLHVVAPIVSNTYTSLVDVVDTGSIQEKFERQLEDVTRGVRAEGIEVESEVTFGHIAPEIEREIRTYAPELVVLGTHGRRGLERWFMGSTTERLLRRSPVPLLIIPEAKEEHGNTAARFKRILVTTDFSEGTTDALDYAFALARENDVHVTLLHVVHLPTASSFENGALSFTEIEDELSEMVSSRIRRGGRVETKVDKGVPHQVILNTIENQGIDLLVMNIHGKGLLERALLGSTAERVVKAASCPVMMIPPMSKSARKTPVRNQAA